MITRAVEWLEERLDAGAWFRRGIVVFTLILTYRLTGWSIEYAAQAKTEFAGVAAVITAVAGVPVGLLTLLFNYYANSRK